MGGHGALTLAAKTFELTTFLTEVAPLPAPARTISLPPVTYHDSCAGLRELGIKEGVMDDAVVINELFEATAEPRWLREALALQSLLDAHFADADGGGYFATSHDHEALIARPKPA